MGHTDFTDEEILRLMDSDWENGSAAVVEKYRGLLNRVCGRRLQDVEDVKECVNSAFADFCLAWDRYEEEKGTLRNYLCTIADRKALERYRKNEVRVRAEERNAIQLTGEGHIGNMDWPGKDMEDVLAEDMDALLKSLGELDERILRKKYYDGETFLEISEELGIPYDTVKKRGERGLKKVMKRLPESCFSWIIGGKNAQEEGKMRKK